ncbi:MAG: hypothetical protein COV31_03225 [Candidatus Yanofskybacteria bacterium CG10_big_fil_rev_8_21_14_0_10_46_23]|uniref:Uncharacterized protein n=1 Tax=Candidatus Yanofskybacteria bacterium CG10_big_fil_rev_8_21_14_0_10_46_23 TaxID=1975098 RepID=A0A2H0R495_9BACT|nr:MAG: hypothetical protein COV31_03225 [Candidatus Yanofskybacteria bacterium CG10_big_fil_rev_8_21_14_0_10_46_23]
MKIKKTNPNHWLDWVLWPILRLLLEPFTEKQSHGWHWRDFGLEHRLPTRGAIKVLKDPKAKPRGGPWSWSNFFQTNFGWQKVVVLRRRFSASPVPFEFDSHYRMGYELAQDGRVTHRQLCSCLIPTNSSVALLIGDGDVQFFGFRPDWGLVDLYLVEITTKSKLDPDIPLI